MSLNITSDLRVSADGAEGHLTADGSLLTLRTDEPLKLWSAFTNATSTGPFDLSTVASVLSDEGLTLEVVGPNGSVASVGHGIDSALGRMVTGSRRVKLGKAAALAPVLRNAVIEHRRAAGVAILAGLSASVLGYAQMRRQRR